MHICIKFFPLHGLQIREILNAGVLGRTAYLSVRGYACVQQNFTFYSFPPLCNRTPMQKFVSKCY